MLKKIELVFVLMIIMSVASASNVLAALDPVNTWTGNVGYSSDGFGSTSQTGTISAQVPVGSTVLAAYLYTAIYNINEVGNGTTLNGTVVNFTNSITASYAVMRRADVTDIVKPIIDAGPGGIYDFSVIETHPNQDGEALIVIYENATLAESTFGLMEGTTDPSGETIVMNFVDPLDLNNPNFFAEMFLGINFSCCGQRSTVAVNGTTITENAGNYDDGGELDNGALITVGGFDDPFSTFLPSYEEDHERYDISPYIQNGDTSITIFTQRDEYDFIFIAGFHVFASDNTPTASIPTLSEWGMIIFSLLLGGVAIWHMRKNSHTGYMA